MTLPMDILPTVDLPMPEKSALFSSNAVGIPSCDKALFSVSEYSLLNFGSFVSTLQLSVLLNILQSFSPDKEDMKEAISLSGSKAAKLYFPPLYCFIKPLQPSLSR